MCKFCKYGKRNSIVDDSETLDEDSKFEITEIPAFWIQESTKEFKDNPMLISYVRFHKKEDRDFESIYSKLNINYCPICGRKLENFAGKQ